MHLIWTKVLSLSVMMVVSFMVGLLPLKVRKLLVNLPKSLDRSQIFMSACLCFGAGILMGTIFLHLLPETIDNVEQAKTNGFIKDSGFPIGELILCSGFFFMYILEELVHVWVHRHQDDTDDHHHVHHQHSHHHNDHHASVGGEATPAALATLYENDMSAVSRHLTSSLVTHVDQHELQQRRASLCHNKRRRCESLPSVAVLVGCDNPVICTDVLTNCTHSTVPIRMSQGDTSNVLAAAERRRSTVGSVKRTEFEKSSVTAFRSVLVILALSVHGCLEGLALGLEEENADVWMLFTALTAHKVAIAFSIGMELLENNVKTKVYVLYMIVFSLASPLGGLVGALTRAFASTETATGVITVMILQGLSGGTILYVVFCEVLERERCKTNGRVARLLALLIGFSVMACLEILGGTHSHTPEEHAKKEAIIRPAGIVYSMAARL